MSQISRLGGNGSGPSRCQVDLSRAGGSIVVSVSGELDAATVGLLEEPLLHAAAAHQDAVVDLSGCGFIDSAVIAALVTAQRCMTRGGASLKVVGKAPSQPLRVLEITGLDDHLPVCETVADAVGQMEATTG